MKAYSSLVKYKFKAGLLLGFMAALAILATDLTSVSYRLKSPVKASHAERSAEDGDQDEAQVSAGKDIVASVYQLTIDHTWHLIADIYQDDQEDQDVVGLDIREYSSWFRTLFRQIISPNAP